PNGGYMRVRFVVIAVAACFAVLLAVTGAKRDRTRLLRARHAVLATPPAETSNGIGHEVKPPSLAEDLFSAVHLEKQSPGPGLIRGRRLSFTVAGLLLAGSVAIGTLFLSGALTSRASQDTTNPPTTITT